MTRSETPPRFSLNQATTKHWALPEVIDASARAGASWVGLWRESVAAYGLARTAKLLADAGLGVSSLCRGGFFTTSSPAERREREADNRAAVEQCAALGCDVLILVAGGLPPGSRDVDAARAQVREGIAELVPYAAAHGVRLAVEALHPMFASDRCVVSTLGQAINLPEAADPGGDTAGVVVDAYHVWWDPDVYLQIARAGSRIASFQVCDWATPLPADVLLGRAMPGAGVIDLRRLREACDAAGYRGPVETEVFNADIWAAPGPDVLAEAIERHREHVA
jgi:sugar phosphate isomerase/epimerase